MFIAAYSKNGVNSPLYDLFLVELSMIVVYGFCLLGKLDLLLLCATTSPELRCPLQIYTYWFGDGGELK